MKRFLLPLSLVLLSSVAHAGDINVLVSDATGKPVKDAVVTFTPAAGVALSAADRKGPFIMAQKNVQFTPFVLAVPVGASVDFPNEDRVNHHVYSFSSVLPFQFPLYSRGKSHSQTFAKAGTEALGCNIHDSMSAYIRVVTTPYYATTDSTGHVTLRNLPETSGSLGVWQPFLDSGDHEMSRPLTISKDTTTLSIAVRLRQATSAGGNT